MALSLLAVIVAGGLTAVVVAATIAGERSVRFDQEFTGAIHVAEAGVQEALHRLNAGELQDDTPAPQVGELNDKPFSWTATGPDPDEPAGTEWRVVSTGGDADGVERTIDAIIAEEPLFGIAAFSRTAAGFSGGNTVDSYTSDPAVPDNDAWCTGNGRVGSNGVINYGTAEPKGPCADEYPRDGQTVDGTDLFDWRPGNDSPGRCQHGGAGGGGDANCYEDGDPNNARFFDTHEDPVEFDDDLAWMEDTLAKCDELPARDYGDHTVIEPADPAQDDAVVKVDFLSDHGAGPGEVHAYCVSELTFDGRVELADASIEEPVVFIVGERIQFDGQNTHRRFLNIGCTSGDTECYEDFEPDSVRPDAGALQIYSPVTDPPGGQFMRASNHWRIGAAIYAPRGTCGGSSGSPQAEFYGSLICDETASIGQWSFHYDDMLAGAVTTGEFVVKRWSEQ